MASTSPYIIFNIDKYTPFLVEALIIIFFVYNSLLMTSNTVVLRIEVICLSTHRGVYPVIRKWHLGVGIKDANNPIKSLFIYPGYLNVVVEADF